MKTRLANVISQKLIVTFKSGERVDLGEYPLDTELNDIKLDRETLVNEHGEILGYGFIAIWDTPSGELEPGCLYWANWLPNRMFWDNQDGPHLMAVLPNGYHWNIDSRASNCTRMDDRTHRCWCRHGELPNITVDKNGNTCSAGAGSIQMGDYHGFLRNGEFT